MTNKSIYLHAALFSVLYVAIYFLRQLISDVPNYLLVGDQSILITSAIFSFSFYLRCWTHMWTDQ